MHYKKISADFYSCDAKTLARKLLGQMLVHESKDGRTAGMIVETESYHQDDPASHAYVGKTQRNWIMFGPGGHTYIYFIYGVHYCVNVTAGSEGYGEAVLIRALEPVEGLELMQDRRGQAGNLTNGPGKLVQAMGITKDLYGECLYSSNKLYIAEGIKPDTIVQTTRIGISKNVEEESRFYIAGNTWVSKS